MALCRVHKATNFKYVKICNRHLFVASQFVDPNQYLKSRGRSQKAHPFKQFLERGTFIAVRKPTLRCSCEYFTDQFVDCLQTCLFMFENSLTSPFLESNFIPLLKFKCISGIYALDWMIDQEMGFKIIYILFL